MARLVVVSYRLGGTDGVSVEAAKWIAALRSLGHRITTVAGAGVADTVLEGLALDAEVPVRVDELARALGDADLVIVENLVSLPLNAAAGERLYDALAQRPALFRHHDLAWQRPQWRDAPAPRDAPWWRHVTINEISRRELAARGVTAVTLYNAFDCDPPPGRRDETRAALGVGTRRLVLLPTRAIERKNVPGAVTLAARLGAVLWLLGPAEDGYDATLDALLGASDVPTRRGLAAGLTVHDAYAAADLVTVPSTWEGFGNPVLESVTHRRPLAVHPYPVLEEIRGFGFSFFELDDVAAINEELASPDPSRCERNLDVARRHFNVADLPGRLERLLATMGLE